MQIGIGGRLTALDAVRGLAIVLVVMGHYLPGRLFEGLTATIVGPFALGGVTLFFMLSGFLIERHLTHDGHLIRYAMRRIMRIFPAYLICLAVIFTLDRITQQAAGWTARDIAGNAMLLQDVLGVPLMSGVFWTLLVETKFYAIAAFVMRAGTTATRIAPYLVIAANTMIYARRGEASNLLTYMTFCFVGMQFGPWSRGHLSTRTIALLIAVTAATSGLFVNYFKVGVSLFVLIDAAIIWLALQIPFKAAPLPFLGSISYSWYLYHAAIGYPLMTGIAVWLKDTSLPTAPISIAAGVLATLAIAWVSYTIIETTGVRLGRALEQHWTRAYS
jgi:peptidoglycan/LPS O-acetylase OafA/YrhL